MSRCYKHNWEDSWFNCPDCDRELEERNRHHEILKIQRKNLEATQAREFNESVRHEEALQAQSQQYFELKRQNDQIIQIEQQRVQLELERDISPIDAFENGNKFDPNEFYRLSTYGELIVERINPYLRLPLKEAFEKGVIEYRNRNFPSDPGREYVLKKTRELGENFEENNDWNITLVVNKNIEFKLFIMPAVDGVLPKEYEEVTINGQSSNVVMRLSDGELLPNTYTYFFDDSEIGETYFEGRSQSLQEYNTPELKLKRLQLRQSRIVSEAINQRKYQEEIKERNAAYELEQQKIIAKESFKHVSGLLSIVIIFLIIPIVWFMGGWDWANFGVFGWPALGVGVALFLYHSS